MGDARVPGGRTASDGHDRAVSQVVGYVLIFALIVSVISFVSIIGVSQLDDTRESEQFQNAERAFDVLNTNMEEVYQRGAPSRATEVSANNARVTTGDAVTFNVTTVDTDGNATVIEREVNPVVMTGMGETEFVYEGGAVFRDQRDGGTVVREPPVRFGDDTVSVTLVRTFAEDRRAIGGSTVLVRAVSTARVVSVADSTPGESQYDRINVTITDSPRQDLWKEFYEESGLDCSESGDSLDCGTDISSVDRTFVTAQSLRIELEK